MKGLSPSPVCRGAGGSLGNLAQGPETSWVANKGAGENTGVGVERLKDTKWQGYKPFHKSAAFPLFSTQLMEIVS